MANVGGKITTSFRNTFRIVDRESLHWFPGHMQKGLKQMQQKLKNVDCVIEVHDARIPISGRYINFKQTVSGIKPHIFVLNKKDLADMNKAKQYEEMLNEEGIKHIVFTNFKDQKCKGMQSILPLAIELIDKSNRYNRTHNSEFGVMVIGVPNVGKSSLINRLRNKYLGKGNATLVGGVAGITRSVLNRIKVSEKPPVFVFDTPGILTPYLKDIRAGLKLALVGCLQDHLVGKETMADYLLFWLNNQKQFTYVEKLKLPAPNDNIMEVLTFIANQLGKLKRIKNYDGQIIVHPDYVFAAEHFLKLFRTGEFGPIGLDNDLFK